jgi:hypothetical protein
LGDAGCRGLVYLANLSRSSKFIAKNEKETTPTEEKRSHIMFVNVIRR